MSASWRSTPSPPLTTFPPGASASQGVAAEGRLGGEQVLLLKPGTYMNESGRAVGEAVRFYKLELDDVIVFHDELDLAPGKVRVKTGGGVAGHNGLKSLTAHIGNDYVRVRIGIGHPGRKELVTGMCCTISPRPTMPGSSRCSRRSPSKAPYLAEGATDKFQSRVAHAHAVRSGGRRRARPRKPAPSARSRRRNQTSPRRKGRLQQASPLARLVMRCHAPAAYETRRSAPPQG